MPEEEQPAAFSALDDPIWNALTSAHRSMARAKGRALRYAPDVSPLAALRDLSEDAFDDLRALAQAGEELALFTIEPVNVPPGWQIVRERFIDQMVCTELAPFDSPPLLALRDDDVPEMLALAAATQPGPFLSGTIRMGQYFGIRSADGRLVAMTGQRLALSGFTEISAVCTDPDFRGRGFARSLISRLAARVLGEGKIPFLHVKTENAAKIVYEKLGFRVRRPIRFTLIAPRNGTPPP